MLLRVTVLTALLAVLLAGLVSGADRKTSPARRTSTQAQSGTPAAASSSTKGGVAPAGFEQFLPKKPEQVIYLSGHHDHKAKTKSCCYELNSPDEECPSLRQIKMMVVTSQDQATLQANAVSAADAAEQAHLKWRCCTKDFTARGTSDDLTYLHCHSNPGAQFWRVSSRNAFEYNSNWD